MIQIDEHGQEFKICARKSCKKPFHQRPSEVESRFRARDYCSAQCRVASNSQPVPKGRQVSVDRPSGFTNPEGVWRPAGFPVFPGGIELAREEEVA